MQIDLYTEQEINNLLIDALDRNMVVFDNSNIFNLVKEHAYRVMYETYYEKPLFLILCYLADNRVTELEWDFKYLNINYQLNDKLVEMTKSIENGNPFCNKTDKIFICIGHKGTPLIGVYK